ncbi:MULTISPECIES: FtsK/SpoIIIE domain-containing protein [unclassified Streptomyces]|uniref:FtsK/SpoIIIE domain-containing protein n=1 Tax=unclassified Streptomyces TaxID=2593676 RepID=UPI000DB9267B|nr:MULTISPECIES: FtsK/SpoIIIE domain-containing protein [unclassified Streptomyces]MYT73844.1 cell division protein FtsK [Streptomyces sp. SID8367]
MLTVVEEGGDAFDIHLDADPDTPVSAVAQALAGAGGVPRPAGGLGLYAGDRLLPADLRLGDAPLHHAAIVGLGRPAGAAAGEPDGLVEIRTVGGTGAGAVHRLDMGEYRIGLGHDGTAQVLRSDPARPLAVVAVSPGGRCRITPDAALPAGAVLQLDREDVTEATAWPPGAQLLAGDSLLELALPQKPDAAVQPSEDGTGWDYNRPPRLRPPGTETRFTLPSPPAPPAARPLPWITALAPLVMAGAGALIFGRMSMLLFGLLSPVAIVGNFIMGRRTGRRSHSDRVAEYEEKKARIEGDATQALTAERTARRRGFPDPAEVVLTAVGPRRRLWERRTTDADFLELRIGTADMDSDVVLHDPTKDEHRRQDPWTAYDVPVTVPLREHDVLGIAGQGETARAVARWAVAQAAVLHSPRDLQIHLLTTGEKGRDGWSWLRWLPHVRKKSGDTPASIGYGTETCARRVAELTALIAERATQTAAERRGRPAGPDVLVVLDGARRLRSLPGVTQILRDGPAVGVRAVCLDAEERLLPEECQAVVAEEPGGTVRVGRSGRGVVGGVRPDVVSADWARSLARAMGPLRDPGGGDEEAAVLPNSARLLDVLALDPPQSAAIKARWTAGGRSTRAAVGVSLDGPFHLDLKRDGPHGLVAGTTGSGKSELLQTLVASLAVANRPDAMTFVLVDYKGGSAFKDCVDLPHTVGMVTDLDAHLVERALVSLTAELTRREHILAAAGAKDIEDYVDLLEREPRAGREPMPRLLIVIDEFASMVRDLPDFVKGLVNIAQRGRSLGIHLILATQRPSGVVSSEIRANTNLRIALRVTDSGESQDVLNSGEAAGISQSNPGRAYVRLGQNSLVPFQSGRVGGRRPGASTTSLPAPWAVAVGWERLGEPLPARPRAAAVADEVETDLTGLVTAIRAADREMGIPAQHSPWLPPLPEVLVTGELPAPPPSDYDLPPVAYGVVDLPAQQARQPLVVDLATLGHLHIIGSPRQGRSQTLRTIAGTLAAAHGDDKLHLYGIDCGNGALLPIERLPHCGAITQRSQPDRVARLLARLTRELTRRQEMLAARGSADLPELRRALPEAERPPHIVLFIDRWEVFDKQLGEYDSGNLLSSVLNLLRDGASVGIHLVMTGDRALFSSRVNGSTEDKLVLKLNEKSEYGQIGITQRNVPDEIPPGRAFRAADKAEVQIALLTENPEGQAQAGALQQIAARCREQAAGLPDGARPFRVDTLPDRLTLEEAIRYAPRPLPSHRWALAGVGGDELTAVGPDFAVTPTFLVAGPARSGRSTVLATLAMSLLSVGTSVVIGAPARSPLRQLAGRPGVLAVFSDSDLDPTALEAALASAPRSAVVILDDADLLLKTKAEPVLTAIAKSGAENRRGLVVAGQTDRLSSGFSGWHAEARRNRCGLLLKPQNMSDGELIGVKVPRSRLGATRPGRAILHLGDGVLRTVQVPETVLPPALV